MDPLQMASRCPGAVALGRARLAGYELAFVWDSPGWGGGVATVIPSSSREVWGVLWDISDQHVETLDRYEGVAVRAYTRDHLDVETDEVLVKGQLYLATDTRQKNPSGRYMDAQGRSARAFLLP